ncbi:MAG: methylenetetrahydrofolate--tRNA-(uracil(54)-C(5))-methyltransferase (FADH(2)-oxidizing) TrmFO [Bacilli bacterium]|nr:methylenetetrahydrofolate--tRNA-(uracil(54)-C(5))-methyltransferase (FADH(2)-oxidizing) TrmFO [Bacilli bacterium]MBN2696998.1 methylenetetrahydrofolate--tRNA-(uracil(54)-C(5))-methyltransferase (FADH(2)-oxidizing) TrmFO [Bacilli bacterium]
MSKQRVSVIGAGLAGVEASLQLAKRNVQVDLYEMKGIRLNPVQKLKTFAELVCSNSFRSDQLENAAGLLKSELRLLGSEVMLAADRFRIPAGSALAVDRNAFSEYLTDRIKSEPLIRIIEKEVVEIPEGVVIVASGPLSSDPLAKTLRKLTGEESLYFYDAVAPIIDFTSIDMEKAYFKNRYDKGDGKYINCPMTRAEYDSFHEAVLTAECVESKDFEEKIFEGCMPFETMARRGYDTLRYGPMKPVGLAQEGKDKPYAVVQLRQDNLAGSLYNIVGFQTHLTFPEQKRIIRMIPGLENARIVRYGVMHKNIFVNSPATLTATYQLKKHPDIFIAGQLSGVEGYVESIGSAMVAQYNAYRRINGLEQKEFPQETMIGAQAFYLANADPKHFQPMNANFGLMMSLEAKHRKHERKTLFANRSIEAIKSFMEMNDFDKQ